MVSGGGSYHVLFDLHRKLIVFMYSHALVLSGCGLPLQIKFQQTGQTILDVIVSLLAGAFGFKPDSIPDLTNWVSLKADRQYLRKGLLVWAQRAGLSLVQL